MAAFRKAVLDEKASEERIRRMRRDYRFGPPAYLAAAVAAPVSPWLAMAICTALWIFWALTTRECKRSGEGDSAPQCGFQPAQCRANAANPRAALLRRSCCRDTSRSPACTAKDPNLSPALRAIAREPRPATTASFRNDERLVIGGAVNLAACDIVDRRGTRQDDSAAQDRAPLDYRTFVNSAIASDQYIVFYDDRQRAHRGLDDAASICAAAEMWQFLPTCAQLPTSACESIIVLSPI